MCLKLPMNHGVSNSLGLMEEVHFLVLGLSETRFYRQSLSLPGPLGRRHKMNILKTRLGSQYLTHLLKNLPRPHPGLFRPGPPDGQLRPSVNVASNL